jgi:hypothetical protein
MRTCSGVAFQNAMCGIGGRERGVEPARDRLAASLGFEVRTSHQGQFSSIIPVRRKRQGAEQAQTMLVDPTQVFTIQSDAVTVEEVDSRASIPVCRRMQIGIEYRRIWLVCFKIYDVGYFDLEQKTLQPLHNPLGTRLLLSRNFRKITTAPRRSSCAELRRLSVLNATSWKPVQRRSWAALACGNFHRGRRSRTPPIP